MNIKTTINCTTNTYLRLIKASAITNRTTSLIIIHLIKKMMNDYNSMKRKNIPVRYQKRLPTNSWHQKHYTIHPNDYEYFLDLRKFYKCSISLLISLAVELYLDDLIISLNSTMNNNCSDNYSIQKYIIINGISEGVVFWHIYWGEPPKKTYKTLIL